MRAYHGTTSLVAEAIARSGRAQQRVFDTTNVSLGGTYVTRRPDLAAVYAEQAARAFGGSPVVLVIDVAPAALLPDEDWVVNAAESSLAPGMRLQRFLDDLFVGYLGEGHSLSDHYKTRYAPLNRAHDITWRDSWRWLGTARLDRPLTTVDVVTVAPLPQRNAIRRRRSARNQGDFVTVRGRRGKPIRAQVSSS